MRPEKAVNLRLLSKDIPASGITRPKAYGRGQCKHRKPSESVATREMCHDHTRESERQIRHHRRGSQVASASIKRAEEHRHNHWSDKWEVRGQPTTEQSRHSQIEYQHVSSLAE